MDARTEKEQLRTRIKERLQRMAAPDRARESRSLCKRVLQALPAEPGVLCVFFPMAGSEADISMLFPVLIAQGWHLYFPRFEGDHFAFRRVRALSSLVPGRWGLMEPARDEDPLDLATVTTVLVPGLAFDGAGGRMGRGNGGYDRWLKELRKKNPHVTVLGIAFECQMVTVVPRETHDEPVDRVITHRGPMGAEAPR